jgi:hypothetical protein
MRVLVPYSGLGTNSTYGMYRWLTETDYEVVAMFLDIYYSSDEYTAFEREHFYRGVKWFKDNIRDFKTIEKKCEQVYPDAYEPVRKNFTLNMETGSYKNMRKVFIDTAKEYKVDFLSSGKSGEDSNGALNKAVSISKGSGYDYIHPSWSLIEPVTLENRDQVIKEMSAKWSQREKLPQELRNIITDCTCKGDKEICYFCTDLLLNEVRPETGQELDDVILEKLCAGKFRHLADPKTFQLNQRTNTYFKLLGYDEEQWVDPVAIKELRDKVKNMYAKAGNI